REQAMRSQLDHGKGAGGWGAAEGVAGCGGWMGGCGGSCGLRWVEVLGWSCGLRWVEVLGWTGLVRNLGPGHAGRRGAEHYTDGAVARWARENPKSQALNARARRLLPGGVTHDVRLTEPFPVAVARAEGARKWDLDGHELICYAM